MRNGKAGVAEDEQTPSDAIEWYVSKYVRSEVGFKIAVTMGWTFEPTGVDTLHSKAVPADIRRLTIVRAIWFSIIDSAPLQVDKRPRVV